MINSFGTIRYLDNYWVWVDVDNSLSRYLRRLFLLGHGIKLQKPSNSDHITVVTSHEKEKINTAKLGYMAGDTVSFSISLDLWTNGNAYWYPVISKDIDNFRTALGLDNPRPIPIHFCIGYLFEGKIEHVL